MRLGLPELLIILSILLLLFGAKRLPGLAKSLGKSLAVLTVKLWYPPVFSISASFTSGGITVGGAMNDVDNVAFDSTNDTDGYEFNIAFAF